MDRRRAFLPVLAVLVVASAVWLARVAPSHDADATAPSALREASRSPATLDGVEEPVGPEPGSARSAVGGALETVAPAAPSGSWLPRLRALGADDLPIAGALVGPGRFGDHVSFEPAESGPDGWARLPPGELAVRVEADGHHPEDLLLGEGDAEVVRLVRWIAVEGRVLEEETDRPIAGAEVRFAESFCFQAECKDGRGTTTSDAEGRYRIDLIPEGRAMRVNASAPDHLASPGSVALMAPSGIAHHDVRMTRGCSIEVRAVAAEDGRPLANARFGPEAAGPGGRARLLLLPDEQGFADLFVNAEGRCPVSLRVGLADPPPLVDVPLPEPATVEVFVRDAEGRPVEGAMVRITPPGQLPQDRRQDGVVLSQCRATGKTDAGGRFRALGLAPEQEGYVVSAFGASGPQETPLPTTPPSGATLRAEVVLTGPPDHLSGIVEGRVTVNGAPATRAYLQWKGATAEGEAWTEEGSGTEAGTFRLEHVEPGAVRLTAWLDMRSPLQHAVADGVSAMVDVLADGPTTGVVLAFEIPLAAVSGRVVGPDGLPAPGARVELSAFRPPLFTTVRDDTDAEGRFTLEVPEREDPYAIRVNAPDAEDPSPWIPVRAGEHDVVLELPSIRTLTVRAVDAMTSEPLRNAYFAWIHEGESRGHSARHLKATTDQEGWLHARLREGTVLVRAACPGYAVSAPQRVELRAGTSSVEIPLELGLEVRIRPGSEPGISGSFQCFLLEEELLGTVDAGQVVVGTSGRPFFRSDALPRRTVFQRRFPLERESTVRDLRPGRYAFVAFPPGLAFDPPVVTIDTGTEAVSFRARQLEDGGER